MMNFYALNSNPYSDSYLDDLSLITGYSDYSNRNYVSSGRLVSEQKPMKKAKTKKESKKN